MADPKSKPAPPPAARASVSSSSEEDSSSEESSRPSTSSSEAESMPPPPQPRASTPPSAAPFAHLGGGVRTPGDRLDETIETRSSRSASTASRSNRLSLTLPIALPTSFPSRPIPASATLPSFPGTPIDLSSAAVPEDPADLITAIAAQERHVLELREQLNRAEYSLLDLKRQWANHEARKKWTGDSRRPEAMRAMPSRPGTASATDSPAASVEGSASRRSTELDRRRALLQSQQPGTVEPNTPSQSRRRVFRGGHARTLSLLSPTKTVSDDFSVHEDQAAAADDESIKSPMSSQDAESPFLQNLGRYAPNTANHLSKRASWAPQTVHQVAGAGLRQVAGELGSTLWTFVEDLRQATVGEELAGANSASGATDFTNLRIADDSQNTIRAPSSTTRPHAARAFGGDLQGTPTPSSRFAPSEQQANKDKAAGSSKAKTGKAGKSDGKAGKRFSWTPLTVDSYDDSDWTNWDSPTVKSPRWSGSTVNGESGEANLEQTDENAAPQKRDSILSTFSPTSPGGKNSELYAALNKLTPGNIKRTATDLMKEWEKSLSTPLDAHAGETPRVEERSL